MNFADSASLTHRLLLLAENIKIRAWLCAAHYLALDEAEDHRIYHQHGYRNEQCWSPGCGYAPGCSKP